MCKRIVNLNRIFNVRQVWEALVLVCFMPVWKKPVKRSETKKKKIGQDILVYNASKNFVKASAVESYFWEGFLDLFIEKSRENNTGQRKRWS